MASIIKALIKLIVRWILAGVSAVKDASAAQHQYRSSNGKRQALKDFETNLEHVEENFSQVYNRVRDTGDVLYDKGLDVTRRLVSELKTTVSELSDELNQLHKNGNAKPASGGSKTKHTDDGSAPPQDEFELQAQIAELKAELRSLKRAVKSKAAAAADDEADASR